MIDFGAVSSALRISWDAPYRLAASVIGIASLGGNVVGRGPLDASEAIAEWAGVPCAQLGGFQAIELWMSERGQVLAPLFAGLALLFFVLVGRRDTRAAATAVLCSAASAQAGGPAVSVFYGAAVALWLLPAIVTLVLERAGALSVDRYGLQHRPALWLSGLLGATFYFPLAFVRWAIGNRWEAMLSG